MKSVSDKMIQPGDFQMKIGRAREGGRGNRVKDRISRGRMVCDRRAGK